jgi:hypothetical protein
LARAQSMVTMSKTWAPLSRNELRRCVECGCDRSSGASVDNRTGQGLLECGLVGEHISSGAPVRRTGSSFEIGRCRFRTKVRLHEQSRFIQELRATASAMEPLAESVPPGAARWDGKGYVRSDARQPDPFALAWQSTLNAIAALIEAQDCPPTQAQKCGPFFTYF